MRRVFQMNYIAVDDRAAVRDTCKPGRLCGDTHVSYRPVDKTVVLPVEDESSNSRFPRPPRSSMAHHYFASAPHFRPYRWAAPEFQIGLQPIGPRDWLLFDGNYADFMYAKRKQLSLSPELFYRTMPGSLAAQRELRRMVVAHLLEEHAALFSVSDGTLMCAAGNHSWDLNDESVEPLWQLSDFVQEDFMLLQEIDGRLSITATSNAYSSSGRLVAAVGRDVRWAHEPVPNLTALQGSRIDRILGSVHEDALSARFNWQITPLSSIFFPPDPHAANQTALRSVSAQLSKDPSLAPSLLHMRVERQTLRRLPETRAVAFSLHTYSDPLSSLIDDPAALHALLALLRDYSAARLQYSEMDAVHAAVIAWIEMLSGVG
jgi:dimethylamine monooxygenase subunit A